MPRYGVLLLLGLTTQSFVGGWHLMAKPTRPRRLVEVIFFFQLASCCFVGCLFWLLAEFTLFSIKFVMKQPVLWNINYSPLFFVLFWVSFLVGWLFPGPCSQIDTFFFIPKGFFLMEPPTSSPPGANTKPKRNGVRPKRPTPRRSSHGCRCCHLSRIGFRAMGLQLGLAPKKSRSQILKGVASIMLRNEILVQKSQHVWKMVFPTQWGTYWASKKLKWKKYGFMV